RGIAGLRSISAILCNYEEGVEEGRVVVLVANRPPVRGDVALAESRKAINVMRMPVAEMLDFGMATLDVPEYTFLILAILKEADRTASCPWTGADDGRYLKRQCAMALGISTDDPSPGFIGLEQIAFIEDRIHRCARHNHTYVIGAREP